ncbi:MAG: PAS domain S-box protein [Verrucomicrobia bacterium]|nr:PAS domain S-box protein [Verrucomicrobiota bacterium]
MTRDRRQPSGVAHARREAKTALAENAREYPLLAEALPDALFITAPSGMVCYVNRAATRFFRRPSSWLVGKRQSDLFPPATARQHTRAIRRVCRTGRPLFAETPERLPGTELWIETRLTPIRNRAGRITHVMGLARDITSRIKAEQALRESEANFRAMAENAIDAILIAAPPGRLAFANRRLANLTGYSMQQLGRMHIAKLAGPAEVQRVMGFFRRRLRGEEVPMRYEAMVLRKDRREIPVEVSANRTIWQGHNAVMLIIRDVSEPRRLAEERRRLASRLIEIQERERLIISRALHDHLGQILTLARLEMGAVRPDKDGSALHLRKALRQLDEALASTRNLASSLRPPILDDLNIETALEDLAGQFAESGLRTTFTHRGGPSPESRHVKTCLYRITQEALTNVARHAHATRVRMHLDVTPGETRLTVRDDGIGFDPEANRKSMGIGLVGMRERLLLCDGHLEIRSARGKGTTVIARILSPDRPGKGEEPS